MKETSDLVPRHIGAVAETITVSLPPDVLMQIARAVAEIMEGRTTLPAAPWMTRREAAEYLRLPLSRLEKDRRIPCHHDRGRVLYHRRELDEYFVGLPNR